MLSKNSLRRNILTRLKRFKVLKGFEGQNALLNLRLQNELRSRHGIWAAFKPLSTEPNLSPSFHNLAGQIQFAFPKVVGRELHFYLNEKDSEFQKGQHGILEPDHISGLRVLASELNGVLVPGVAFDSCGNRLGRGRAFYDRFLKNCHAPKIGVCFHFQYFNQPLKTQTHDEKIDRLITENFCLNLQDRFGFSGFSERNFI